MVKIPSRPYTSTDRTACLGIFDGNVPTFFAPQERAEFRQFLDACDSGAPYLVLAQNGRVVACGGLQTTGHSAALAWGMVDRALHGHGLGTQLTKTRLALARSLPNLAEVTLAPSQHPRGFYESFGFAVTKVTPGGFGPGLDRCDMQLNLHDG